jgi:hypothetical protein
MCHFFTAHMDKTAIQSGRGRLLWPVGHLPSRRTRSTAPTTAEATTTLRLPWSPAAVARAMMMTTRRKRCCASVSFVRARASTPWTSRRWTFPVCTTTRSALHLIPQLFSRTVFRFSSLPRCLLYCLAELWRVRTRSSNVLRYFICDRVLLLTSCVLVLTVTWFGETEHSRVLAVTCGLQTSFFRAVMFGCFGLCMCARCWQYYFDHV